MSSPLEDLDELILRCRDQNARLYIAEAVASYRAGAFRSAIVTSWIAVCFDVIEKLRELALAGDKEAENQIRDLETIRRTADLTRALKFERELLGIARDKFELLSPLEHIDLERLQEDRNRCAHPSLTSDDMAYTPSAELARLHIHSAVTHLLQHPPVQGKFALDRIVKEVESEYFPTNAKEARVVLASGPLRRPRESLVRNLVIVFTKSVLKDNSDYKRCRRLTSALRAIGQLHPKPYAAALSESLSKLFQALPDGELHSATTFLQYVDDSWQYLDAAVRKRLQNYVRNLPSLYFEDVEFLLKYTPLQAQARRRVSSATKKDLTDTLLFFKIPIEVIDRYIDFYLASESFEEANSLAKQMFAHTSAFTPDHVRRIIAGAGKNFQISGSFQIKPLIKRLRDNNILATEEFEELLKAHLEDFATQPVKTL